jgi:hypothetical protein
MESLDVTLQYDEELNGVPVIHVPGTDILYQFGQVEGLEPFRYRWTGIRTGKIYEMTIWVNGREHFLQLLTAWNAKNHSFRFEEVP